VVTAENILIATGGRPNPHPAMPGHELCIVSDNAFHLTELPKSIVIAGGGYIAVEFANIFHGLGVETTLVYRGKEILGRFDNDLRQMLHEAMEAKGIRIVLETNFSRVEKRADGKLAAILTGGGELVADQIMLAIGRMPNTERLGLDKAGVAMGRAATSSSTTIRKPMCPSIYAVGDVTDRVQLTPVAIHEAMCLVDTLFRGKPTKPDLDKIATAVFSQPEIGTVGLSEEDAGKKYRRGRNLPRRVPADAQHPARPREKMLTKLVVDAKTRIVVGAHILGPDAGEMAQLLGIVIKGNLTKDVVDATMAVHPTAAEEFVTMYQPSYRLKMAKRVD
jgi:glutathione reductase (NADPH)